MKTHRNLSFAALALLSASAFASGPHAGGHDHSETDAIGKAGVAGQAKRTVKIDMADSMRFTPADIAVKQNETVRFVISNSGKVRHEFALGTPAELKEHYELMKKNPEMEHADANMVTVDPGKTAEVVWQFTRPGKVDFACLQPGHYDAGMKGGVTVAKLGAK